MKNPPKYTITSKIKQLLFDIEVLKKTLELHPNSLEHTQILRNKSLLKSALYSARIEGNSIEYHDIQQGRIWKKQELTEIQNLNRAYSTIEKLCSAVITPGFIRHLHANIMKGLSSSAGFFRNEESAIYNQAGIAVYLAPAPREILPRIQLLCDYINDSTEHILIRSGVSHVWFEKIHPFMDGNGRVGRVLLSSLLSKGGFDFGGIVPFEEYLENHRDEYYEALNQHDANSTIFIELFLTAIYEKAMESLSDPEIHISDPLDTLLPRRAEIVRIITDHKMITFDFLYRRFLRVNKRTLHNDLQYLMKQKLIRKRGVTRGAEYEIV